MAEVLLRFRSPVRGLDGIPYAARACGTARPDGLWEGWLEFVPEGGGPVIRSSRETTQPTRRDVEYWATGLTPVFLDGALQRALEPSPLGPAHPRIEPAFYSGPHNRAAAPASLSPPESVMNPFSVYRKGEALLRKQLAALTVWHLVNIAIDYELSDLDATALNRLPAATLVELIVAAVRRTPPAAGTSRPPERERPRTPETSG
jgi:hypothetical protein